MVITCSLNLTKAGSFFVVSDALLDGKIRLGYFDSHKGTMMEVDIEPSQLEYSIEEMYRRLNKLNGND